MARCCLTAAHIVAQVGTWQNIEQSEGKDTPRWTAHAGKIPRQTPTPPRRRGTQRTHRTMTLQQTKRASQMFLAFVLSTTLFLRVNAQCYLMDASAECPVCWRTVYGSSSDTLGVTTMSECDPGVCLHLFLPHFLVSTLPSSPYPFLALLSHTSLSVSPSLLRCLHLLLDSVAWLEIKSE